MDRKVKLSTLMPDYITALANSVPQLGWVADSNGELIWFNQQWYDYTGLTPQESYDNGWFAIHHPDQQDNSKALWNTSVAEGSIYEVTYQLRRHDGAYRWFLTRALPTLDDNGSIKAWVGTATDIEETKQAQGEISTIIESIDEGFLAIDKNWHLQMHNSYHLKKMTENGFLEQVGKNFLEKYFPGYAHKNTLFYKNFVKAMNERIVIKFEDYYPPAKIWAAVNVYPKADGGLAIFYRDISHEKKAQKELIRAKEESERANQLKTAFLANMSHEIRTPLSSIMGFAELLKCGKLSDADKERFLQMIIKNGENLSRIIDDILDLSKVEAGHIEIENIEMAFDHLLHEVLALFREKVKSKNINLKLNLSSDVPTRIKSDPTRIRQILINLISNAVKFTKEGSVEITINSENVGFDKCHFQVSIKDTGIGLSDLEIEKLFRPFTQADNSTTRKYGGTGLGLALSKHLAQALGGDIRVLNSTPGSGSTFTFDFVAETTTENNTCQIPENTHPPVTIDLTDIKVLLAEDSPDSQELIKHVLVSHGASVTLANDGAEVLQLAKLNDYDIVLMDIQMPEIDGYEATRRLRSLNYKIPIVALTAHAMLEERQKSRAAGCDAHVTKPLNFRKLLSTVYFMTSAAQRRYSN